MKERVMTHLSWEDILFNPFGIIFLVCIGAVVAQLIGLIFGIPMCN